MEGHSTFRMGIVHGLLLYLTCWLEITTPPGVAQGLWHQCWNKTWFIDGTIRKLDNNDNSFQFGKDAIKCCYQLSFQGHRYKYYLHWNCWRNVEWLKGLTSEEIGQEFSKYGNRLDLYLKIAPLWVLISLRWRDCEMSVWITKHSNLLLWNIMCIFKSFSCYHREEYVM